MAKTWDEMSKQAEESLRTRQNLTASFEMLEMLRDLNTRCLKMQEELDRLRGKDQDEGLPTLPEPSSGDSPPFVNMAGSEPAPASSSDSVAGRIASG